MSAFRHACLYLSLSLCLSLYLPDCLTPPLSLSFSLRLCQCLFLPICSNFGAFFFRKKELSRQLQEPRRVARGRVRLHRQAPEACVREENRRGGGDQVGVGRDQQGAGALARSPQRRRRGGLENCKKNTNIYILIFIYRYLYTGIYILVFVYWYLHTGICILEFIYLYLYTGIYILVCTYISVHYTWYDI